MLIIYWSNENRLWESVFSYALSKGKETYLMNLIWFQPQKHICTVIIFLAKYMCLPKVIYWSIRYEYSGSCDKHLILNDRISILIDISFSFFWACLKWTPHPHHRDPISIRWGNQVSRPTALRLRFWLMKNSPVKGYPLSYFWVFSW